MDTVQSNQNKDLDKFHKINSAFEFTDRSKGRSFRQEFCDSTKNAFQNNIAGAWDGFLHNQKQSLHQESK